jgi:hypothetical protein
MYYVKHDFLFFSLNFMILKIWEKNSRKLAKLLEFTQEKENFPNLSQFLCGNSNKNGWKKIIDVNPGIEGQTVCWPLSLCVDIEFHPLVPTLAALTLIIIICRKNC